MSIKNRNIDIIDHILNYCYQIGETRQRFGNNFDNFQADKIYQNAVCMCILQIGELSKYLTDDFKNLYSEIPWKQIRGIRNIFAHDYGSIDVLTIWNTINYNIPELKDFCENILAQNKSLNQEALHDSDISDDNF
ncbi:DUF86 domain-containing protein [Eubacterium limosum]|uniref:HepT-like ribonuclease domain-containing protein n=1 Tax=Eubacterium limosum TaxID=1736 RepID=UPI001063C203|nr:HepT-like ribonuclease domain-containing protein [Eubacterium limosum]